MSIKYLYLLVVIAMLAISSCKKESPIVPPVEIPPTTKAVYVVNEGNFGRSNSTLTVYPPDSNKAYQDVFAAVNGRNLGDVGNDMVLYKDRGYIVVNNSQKIEVIKLSDHTSVGTLVIPGNKSPYKLSILNDSKAYVTNLFDNSVTVFNPLALALTKQRIPVGLNPQGIAAANNKMYVCNSGFGSGSTVSIISTSTDTVVKTLVVGNAPSGIEVDADGDVIVKCDGAYNDFSNPNDDTPGSLVIINVNADTIAAVIPLPLATYGHPGRSSVSKKGYGFVQVNTGILKFSTSTNTIISDAFITTSSYFPYSLAVDDVTERVYVADAKDYVQPGQVFIYDKTGQQIGRFDTGIIPGTIAFKR